MFGVNGYDNIEEIGYSHFRISHKVNVLYENLKMFISIYGSSLKIDCNMILQNIKEGILTGTALFFDFLDWSTEYRADFLSTLYHSFELKLSYINWIVIFPRSNFIKRILLILIFPKIL